MSNNRSLRTRRREELASTPDSSSAAESPSRRRRRLPDSKKFKAVKISKADVKSAFAMLQENMEPCFQGHWRRRPWPCRPYERLEGYAVATDIGEAVDVQTLQIGLTTNKDASSSMDKALHPTMHLETFPERCRLGIDVAERPVWGIDCFTRKLLHDCLKLCPEIMNQSSSDIDLRSAFIERQLLPAMNALGKSGWNMFEAMDLIRSRAEESNDDVLRSTSLRMLQLMLCIELREWKPLPLENLDLASLANCTDNFRAHPKVHHAITSTNNEVIRVRE